MGNAEILEELNKSKFKSVSEQKRVLSKKFKDTFPLVKKIKKEVDQFDVSMLLKILDGHSIFGKSFRDEIVELYNLLKKAEKVALKIYQIKNDRYESDKKSSIKILAGWNNDLNNYLERISQIESKIMMDLNKSHLEIKSLSEKLNLIRHDEDLLKDYLLKIERDIQDNGVVPKNKSIWKKSALSDFNASLDVMIPLFNTISREYKDEFKDVQNLISDEVSKIDHIVESKNKKIIEVNFEQVLAHIKQVQDEFDKIISNAVNAKKESVKLKDANKITAQIIYKMMKDKDISSYFN